MRRSTLAGLGTLALVTLLAACNGGGSNADSTAVLSDSTATDPTPMSATTDSMRADSIRRADSAAAATKTP